MRRVSLGLIASSSAVVLVALGYTFESSRQFADAPEAKNESAGQLQEISLAGSEPSNTPRMEPLQPSFGNNEHTSLNQDQASATVFLRDGSVADLETTDDVIREDATDTIRRRYALLLEDLSLSPEEKERMLALLIEDEVASTSTPYRQGQAVEKDEQSRRIAAIIGDERLQQFRELESNLGAYGEVQKIDSLLQTNGVPLTDHQRDGLLEIVAGALKDYAAMPKSTDVERGSIESAQGNIARIADYERHVMELVPSVLTEEQVVYLDEQYQYMAYWRANAIEQQKRAAADGTAEDRPASFPLWTGN